MPFYTVKTDAKNYEKPNRINKIKSIIKNICINTGILIYVVGYASPVLVIISGIGIVPLLFAPIEFIFTGSVDKSIILSNNIKSKLASLLLTCGQCEMQIEYKRRF